MTNVAESVMKSTQSALGCGRIQFQTKGKTSAPCSKAAVPWCKLKTPELVLEFAKQEVNTLSYTCYAILFLLQKTNALKTETV